MFLKHFLLLLATKVLFLATVSLQCTNYNVKTCEECIRSGPDCAWCKKRVIFTYGKVEKHTGKQNFTKVGEPDSVRCDTMKLLQQRGCERDIIFPKSYASSFPVAPSNMKKQLYPDVVNLRLRPADLLPKEICSPGENGCFGHWILCH